MAVAEIFVNQTSVDEITMDFSPWVSRLGDPETTYGFAYAQTLNHLGLEHSLEPTDWHPRVRVHGLPETVREHLPTLHEHIATVALDAAQKEVAFPGHNQRTVERILGKLAQETIPALDDSASLSELIFAIAYPFGKQLHEKGVYGHLDNCKAPWRADEIELEVQKKKQSLFGPGRLFCIPTHPNLSPEEELAQLNSLPDQRSWFTRQEEDRLRAREKQAIDYLVTRGFSVERVAVATDQ